MGMAHEMQSAKEAENVMQSAMGAGIKNEMCDENIKGMRSVKGVNRMQQTMKVGTVMKFCGGRMSVLKKLSMADI